MGKETLLVADSDPRSLRMLELALRRAGFEVESAADGQQAMSKLRGGGIHAAVCDLALPAPDGMEVCRAARADEQLAAVPIVLVGGDRTAAAKARALEAGADDYLPKPLLLKEVVQRVQHLLDRRRLSDPGVPVALTGAVRDLGLVDALQSLETWGKSAVVRCENGDQLARLWVYEGEVVDAELGPLLGEVAFWRVMGWESGTFRVEFADTELRERRMRGGTQAALVEAMRRIDVVERIASKLPLQTQLAIDVDRLADRLAVLPDEVNGVLRHFDGVRTVRAAIDLSLLDDVAALGVVQRLVEDGILRPVSSRAPLLAWTAAPSRPASAQPPEQPQLVQFAPARGVRRARLRREAGIVRERIAAGAPVLLHHVVELPPRQPAESLGELRRISDAAGDVAKTFAPDAQLARVLPRADSEPTPIAPVAPDSAPPKLAARRWPWALLALAGLALLWALRPQPRTDRKDSPWLESNAPSAPQAAPAPAPPRAAAVEPAAYAEAVSRGNDLFRAGKYRAAAAEYKKALAARPQAVPVLVALGDAWLEADKPRSAVEPLESAARLDPASARAQLLLGTAYQSLGRKPDAVRAYRRFLELEPASEYAKDVKAILASLGG